MNISDMTHTETYRPLRSMLFAPGNHPRKVEKVFASGADAVILDLEDAVATSEKVATRQVAVDALSARSSNGPAGYIRVNCLDTEFCYGDLNAVIGPWLTGIVLPKVESPDQLKTVDGLLEQREREKGLQPGSIDLLPIIETSLGVSNTEAIANSGTRVKRLTFGAGDLTADLNMEWTADELELYHIRARVALASRTAGLAPPIDTVHVRLKDLDSFRRAADGARALGYFGKLCIHPDQVEPTNAAYTPSPEDVAEAHKIIAAIKEAEASGSASIQVEGQFVDYPIVERAQRTLAVIEAIGS